MKRKTYFVIFIVHRTSSPEASKLCISKKESQGQGHFSRCCSSFSFFYSSKRWQFCTQHTVFYCFKVVVFSLLHFACDISFSLSVIFHLFYRWRDEKWSIEKPNKELRKSCDSRWEMIFNTHTDSAVLYWSLREFSIKCDDIETFQIVNKTVLLFSFVCFALLFSSAAQSHTLFLLLFFILIHSKMIWDSVKKERKNFFLFFVLFNWKWRQF